MWFRMITGELSALKYADMLDQPVNKEEEANYDPEDEVTKGRIHHVSTFLLGDLKVTMRNVKKNP